MTFDEMILRPVRPVVAAWLARLADRVNDLRVQARLGVFEAVGRTTAEAVEWLLQSALGVAKRCDLADAYAADEFDDDLAGGVDPRVPPSAAPGLAWAWRTLLVATLHAVRGWVAYWAPQLVSVIAALIGAAVVVLD